MAIYTLGSINADYVYPVAHLPQRGETVQAAQLTVGLGGKGANQSVAAAKAGARVHHIGAVGVDGRWAVERLGRYGVDTAHVAEVEGPTGHAIIVVDPKGDNLIVTLAGANAKQSRARTDAALAEARPGDSFLLQNETTDQQAVARAQAMGLRVVYSAAPFSVDAVRSVWSHVDLLVVNAIEAGQLCAALETEITQLPVPGILVTKGGEGATWHDLKTATRTDIPAFAVEPVDTTGAGDTYLGYLVAGLDQGLDRAEAMRRAAAAAAIKVTRPGAADAIPDKAEVEAFLAGQS